MEIGMTKSKVALVVTMGVLGALLSVGCGKDEVESAASSKPGPAVGSTTPQGGVITVESQHGKRPHMAGGPGK